MRTKHLMLIFFAMTAVAGCAKKNNDLPANAVSPGPIMINSKLNSLAVGADTVPPTDIWVNIINKGNGLVFAFKGHNTDPHTALVQEGNINSAAQRFKITAIGSGTYRITPSMPYRLGKCLQVADSSLADGATVEEYPFTGSTHQLWRFVSTGGGYVHIVNVNSGKVIEVPGSSTTGDIALTQNTASTTATNQQWRFNSAGPTTVNVECNGCTPWFPSAISGTWIMMHRNNYVTIKSDGGGSSRYTTRYETEYWVGSGAINPPSIVVLSGTNTLTSTSGTSNPGTCTGTAFPSNAYYSLNGSVKWTDNENGCSYNLALSSL